MKNPAAALGLVLFAVFLLTSSGHTYSPDEESLVYVTQAFVTRGDFNIPDPHQYPVVGGHRGIGGEIYSGTGLAQSFMTAPLYVVGNGIANAFDFHYRDFILRVVIVSLFNPLIAALTGVLLFAWMRRLGFSVRACTALVSIYAFGTLAWVYARMFFIEPLLTLYFVLAAFSLRVFHDSRASHWMIVAGLAAGMATLTKLQGLLVLPALGIYFITLEFPVWWGGGTSPSPSFLGRGTNGLPPLRRGAKRGLSLLWSSILWPGILFLAALGAGLVLVGYLDFIRFGDPLQSGYGGVAQDFPIMRGLYGLLLSSGKSIFLYAPPIVLSIFAFPRFLKRYGAEACFCAVLIATIVLFHARLAIWSGDGAWGPRYMVSTLPFWILPIGAILGEWWHGAARRLAVVALVAAGLLVNLLGLSVNFDTYIQIQPDGNARSFVLAASPLPAHWNLLRERIGAWWSEIVAPREAVTFVKGFLATGGDALFPRYLAPHALILVKSSSARPLQMSLLALDYRPDQMEKRRLIFFANGASLDSRLLPESESGYLNYRVQIPAASASPAVIDILTTGSQPVGKSPMGDELGVHLQSLDVSVGGHSLPVFDDVMIPPLPTADPKAMWAWFYEPANAHFDFLWWYLYFTGLGDLQVGAIITAMACAGIGCLIAGVTALRSVLKREEATGA